jgi:AraC-like DNA-binding protein
MKKANIVLLPVYLLLTSFRKIRIGCKMISEKRCKMRKEDRLRGDGLKVSNVYLDIGYYSLSTSSVTFKNKFGIGQKGYG